MRYNPKMRRRRQAKTDYAARRVLILQDADKFGAAKFRFVVRITNKDVCCQFVRAKLIGDEVLCAAYASELRRFGVTVGLTNYAACYATGLLCARRLLKKLGLDEQYEGLVEASGEYFMEEKDYEAENADEAANPFYAVLDVGLRRTTTGARVYAALKGAVDGGVEIPYSTSPKTEKTGKKSGKQFPGYELDEESKRTSYAAEVCTKYILGGHVADYMRLLQEEDEEKYRDQFSKYIAAGVGADDLEDMYRECHSKIRANPEALPKKQAWDGQTKSKFYKPSRPLTRAERRDHVLNRILARRAKAAQQ